jgi:8-oxo-dGTP diphosphatase
VSVRRHRELACAIVIDLHGRFLLQQRDNVPHIILPGKIGLFGGHREGDETFLECVVREVHEEISYFVPPERFKHLGGYVGDDDEAPGGTVSRQYYVVRDIPSDALTVTEGSLLIAKREDLPSLAPKLAPAAQAALDIFFSAPSDAAAPSSG